MSDDIGGIFFFFFPALFAMIYPAIAVVFHCYFSSVFPNTPGGEAAPSHPSALGMVPHPARDTTFFKEVPRLPTSGPGLSRI